MTGILTTLALLISGFALCTLGNETPTTIPEKRIIGGTEANPNEFPHHVLIVLVGEMMTAMLCGGSILTPEYVLTAAHCVHNRPVDKIRIFIGTHDLKGIRIERLSEQGDGVNSVFVHACFNRTGSIGVSQFLNDIALIRLDRRLGYTQNVKSIRIDVKDRATTGTGVTLIGWGRTSHYDEQNVSSLLKKAGMNIGGEQCKRFPFLHKDSQVCAFSGAAFACQGDSGGSMICRKDGKRYVCGITSFVGVQYVGDISCRTPSVYTRVVHFRKWIIKTVKRGRQPSVDCDNLDPGPVTSGSNYELCIDYALMLILVLRFL